MQYEQTTCLSTQQVKYQFSYAIEDKVYDFFSNCVMTSSIVVCSIFFTSDKLFRMEKLTVSTGSYLICKIWSLLEFTDKNRLTPCSAFVCVTHVIFQTHPHILQLCKVPFVKE